MVNSQFITDDFLRKYDYDFNFIEKKEDPALFIKEVVKRMIILRKRQSCFIAMPFAAEYNKIFQLIQKAVKHSHYRCIRIDQQEFTNSIIQKIFAEINNAKLIVFLATDKNPNAFYECGYSVALNKEVVTITDIFDNLPFDIRDRNALAYGKNMAALTKTLSDKIEKLTKISS